MIALQHICARAGTFHIGPLNVQVQTGEHLWLTGPSGSGKSLLLRVIAGLQQPVAGSIVLRGVAVNDMSAQARRLAWLPQQTALFPHLNVADNLAFGLQGRGLSWRQRRARVLELAAALELTHLLRRGPATLSGGESQRVALGRALAWPQDILLLDEPFAALDHRSRDKAWNYLRTMAALRPTTIVHASHDRAAMGQWGGRQFVLCATSDKLERGRLG